MYVILTYDVKQQRVAKVMKTCRKYLTHVQKSVFEGLISDSKLTSLKHELEKVILVEEDSVCIYGFETIKYMKKEMIGVVENHDNII